MRCAVTVVKPAGVEVRSVWDGSDAVKAFASKPRSEDAPPASLQVYPSAGLQLLDTHSGEDHTMFTATICVWQ